MGVGTALLLIDRLGRRPLLIGGSAACCLSMLVIAAADASADVYLLLTGMCGFIVAFRCARAPNSLRDSLSLLMLTDRHRLMCC